METSGDEVDRIVAAWGRERPDLAPATMEIFSRITRLSRLLDLHRREAFASFELEVWEFDVLSALRRAGAPYALTPGALMNNLLVSSGTMTNRIDRLEAKGLVQRSPSPTDRRAVLVTITSEGISRVDGALAALLEKEREVLAALDVQEHGGLAAMLRTLLLTFED